jgi:sarcosine oxidase, subunit alpha
VGLGFLWSRNKPEAKTVGAVALEQTLNQKDRLKLVGIKMEQANQTPKDGSIVVDSKIRGYVCIARNSFNVKASVGMALVDAPLAETGKQLEIFEDGAGDRRIIARVVPLPFYDPEGKRMKM